MYTITFFDDNDQGRPITSLASIEYELGRVREEKGYTLALSSRPNMNDITELYVVNDTHTKGIFTKTTVVSYFIGVEIGDMEFAGLGIHTDDFEEVKNILRRFIEDHQPPDYTDWNK